MSKQAIAVFNGSAAATMTSVELVEVINSMREAGKAELRHDTFMKKVAKVLGNKAPEFSGTQKYGNNLTRSIYNFPKREAELMVMSESYAVQAKVYDRMTALEIAIVDPLASLPAEHRALIAVMVENAQIKATQAAQQVVQIQQSDSIKRLEAKQSAFEDGHSFFTVMGFCALRGVKLVMADMQRLGKLAANLSKLKDYPIDKVRDARFGLVNSYHENALQEAFGEIHGGM
jgi:hypothetical protein